MGGKRGLKLGRVGGEAGVRDVTQEVELGDNQNVVGESERNQIGRGNSGGKSTALDKEIRRRRSRWDL